MPGLKVTWRNGIAVATGSVAGQRVRKSLGTRDPATAQELCAQYEARLWKRHSYGEEAVRTFEEAAVSYLENGGEGKYLEPIIRHFRGRALGTIKPGEITDLANKLYPTGKGSTKNRHVLVPARAVIRHAAKRGWCSPVEVENFESAKPRRLAVDRSWINAVMAQADKDGLPHLSAILLFMFQTGARVSEAVRIMPEHVDIGKRMVLLERTKTGEWEERHITEELAVRLDNLGSIKGKPLFRYASRYSVRLRTVAVCRRAGIPFVSAHQAGRHSFATNALAYGATVKEVMVAGGWKSAKIVLETYAHAEGAGPKVAGLFDTNRAQSKPKIRQVSGKKRKS